MDVLTFEEPLESFVNIPKIELHAHLNGSLSKNTVRKLNDLKQRKSPICNQNFSDLNVLSKDLADCFKQFSLIHDLMDSPEAIYMATCDVIKDFSDDGVHYLELRTTPKAVGNCMDQESYLETVLKAIDATQTELNGKISVKLLLSIDRKRSFNSAEKTIKIAENYFTSSNSVVGIDFSGDPTVGGVCTFTPLLEYARKVGLKLTVHISEVPNADKEVKELLNLSPHRLGHGTFLHPSKGGSVENFTTLSQLKIPLEICLSSNLISKTVSSYKEHHFQLFRELNYPCVLCTDDKGIFNTSLSKEYCLASHYYSLTIADLYDMSYKSIDYIFSSDSEKDKLKTLWKLRNEEGNPTYSLKSYVLILNSHQSIAANISILETVLSFAGKRKIL